MHIWGNLRQKSNTVTLSFTLVLCAALIARTDAQKLTTFDEPNAATVPLTGTEAQGINDWGTIVGDYADSRGGVHGYIRTADGKYVSFDAPGANPAPGYNCLYFAGGTCPQAINDLGTVAGFEGDANGVFHGFVRTADGKIATFDAPGAGAGAGQGTFAYSINAWRVIAGYTVDGNGTGHGFVRRIDGTFTIFDDPEGGTGPGLGTFPSSINDEGAISGVVTEPTGFSQGFVRDSDGKIANFDAPGATSSSIGTGNVLINDTGIVAGSVFQGSGYVTYGFEGDASGKMITFQAPEAGVAGLEGTNVNALNVEGTTTGYVTDSNEENHTFVRYANGKAVTFDVPGQLAVPGSFFGSAGYGINAFGVVAGRWHDANLVLHAYVWSPQH
jgi:hypothetical protein